MITLLLISIYFPTGDSCWSKPPMIPPIIDPYIVDNATKPVIPQVNTQLFADYMKKLPWLNTPTGESSWPSRCKWSSLTKQSPINISTEKAVRDFEKHFIKYGALQFRNYDRPMKAIAFNNGNTLQFICQAENARDPSVRGGPLDRWYRLEQVHYHWPSEHAIDGHKFPMEIHFVHIRNDLDVDTALKTANGLAILAIFWIVIMGWHTTVLPSADRPYFIKLAKPGTQLKHVELNVGALIKTNHKAYFTYHGSLSSPDCQEVVTWIVFETPIYVPESLFRAFAHLGVLRNNYRSLKPIKSHKVFRTPYRAIMTPLLGDTFADTGRIMNAWSKNFTRKAFNISRRIAKAGIKMFKLHRENLYKNKFSRNAYLDNKTKSDTMKDNSEALHEEPQAEEIEIEETNEKDDIPVNVETGLEDMRYDKKLNNYAQEQTMDFDNLVRISKN